jgi:hypothetical protein
VISFHPIYRTDSVFEVLISKVCRAPIRLPSGFLRDLLARPSQVPSRVLLSLG